MSNVTSGLIQIYTGTWINWSEGRIRGSTLTLSAFDSQVFSAAIALFVSFVGTYLWKILRLVAHQIRVPGGPVDGLYHQQQVSLRNSRAALDTVEEFALQAFAWRNGRASRAYRRTLPWIVAMLAFFAGWSLLSIFSSEILVRSSSKLRLLKPGVCGDVSFDVLKKDNFELMHALNSNMTLAAKTWAEQCYGGRADPVKCDLFPIPAINWKANAAKCPFSEVCYDKDLGFEMDTGIISSWALGINQPEAESVQYRRISTCAPLNTQNYVRKSDPHGSQLEDLYDKYFYGELYLQKLDPNRNDTYRWNTAASLTDALWTVESHTYYDGLGDETQDWRPIQSLRKPNADTSIVFLSPNGMDASAKIDDPIFETELKPNTTDTTLARYRFVNSVGVIACTDQHVLCNLKGLCSDRRSQTGFRSLGEHDLDLNDAQKLVAQRLYQELVPNSVIATIGQGSPDLKALQITDRSVQLQLPANQWELEVSSWFESALAQGQFRLQEFAIGPRAPGAVKAVNQSDAELRTQCSRQLTSVQNGTVSYRILGIALVVVIGGLIVLVDFLLEHYIGQLHRVLPIGEHRHARWILDEKLQLQRVALEMAGMGTWSRTTDPVPVTETGERFEGFDNVHPKHSLSLSELQGETTGKLTS